MKPKYHFLSGLLFLAGFITHAQEILRSKASGYVELSGGFTLPQKPYSTGNSMVPGGYALPGGSFAFSYGVTPSHFPFGFAMTGGYYFNRYDLNSYLTNHQTPDVSFTYGTNQPNANKLYYHGLYGMAGLYKEFSLTQKVGFNIRALAGSLGLTTPEISYYALQSSPKGTEYMWDISNSKGSAFGYNLGATIRVKPGSILNLFVNLDYLYSDLHYNTALLYSSTNNTTTNSATTSSTGGSGYTSPSNTGTGYYINGSTMYGSKQFWPTTYKSKTTPTGNKTGTSFTGINGNLSRYVNSDNLIIAIVFLSIGVGFNL